MGCGGTGRAGGFKGPTVGQLASEARRAARRGGGAGIAFQGYPPIQMKNKPEKLFRINKNTQKQT